ncbi:hypothetical protein [Roseimicrobium sp. ORNL1]|uniref:hypothetical protein n=1 Tax=Roseimicrobium sp. ORNL1 TaxID=2711231 RepID=UPI0013E12019|nr:hypothetical protein [Roseimicrobium sp. ORNL1]QIF02403.1 hypothetical protein G5S37_13005 [Roseimicrobium sp. ORNL1]
MKTISLFSATMISLLLLLLPACTGIDWEGKQAWQLRCHDAQTGYWKAWANLQPGPGGPKDLHVTAKAEVNSGGWEVKLTKRSPQGINPRILQLELHVTSPSGPATQVKTELDVKYTEKGGAPLFDKVEVFCGERLLTTKLVEQVH